MKVRNQLLQMNSKNKLLTKIKQLEK